VSISTSLQTLRDNIITAGWYTKATERLSKKLTCGHLVLVMSPVARCHFSKQLGRKKWQNVVGLLF